MRTEITHLHFKDFYGYITPILCCSFWKRDLQTFEDQRAIGDLIDHLFNAHCFSTAFLEDTETLREIIKVIPHKRIGFFVSTHETGEPELYYFNANDKTTDSKEITPIHFI
jgi:hypothetical protein